MKNLSISDILESWKRWPAWTRASVWFLLGILLGCFLKA